MEQRSVGRSGLRVSVVGLGCNNFGSRLDPAASRAVIDRAIDRGINFFDTADAYGRGASEEIIGEALGSRRRDIVVATKFGLPMRAGARAMDGSRRYLIEAVEASLRRLRTDWIDLYQIHRPDAETPIEETLGALDDLVRTGKVRYIGCSNFAAWQVADAVWTARRSGLSPLISSQDEFNLLERAPERELFPALHHYGMGFLPYFPLAGGLLSGKYRKGHPLPEGTRLTTRQSSSVKFLSDRNLDLVEKLALFAELRGRTLLELAVSWLASQPPVASVIAGAMSPEQVDANASAADCQLSSDELAEIDRIATGAD